MSEVRYCRFARSGCKHAHIVHFHLGLENCPDGCGDILPDDITKALNHMRDYSHDTSKPIPPPKVSIPRTVSPSPVSEKVVTKPVLNPTSPTFVPETKSQSWADMSEDQPVDFVQPDFVQPDVVQPDVVQQPKKRVEKPRSPPNAVLKPAPVIVNPAHKMCDYVSPSPQTLHGRFWLLKCPYPAAVGDRLCVQCHASNEGRKYLRDFGGSNKY